MSLRRLFAYIVFLILAPIAPCQSSNVSAARLDELLAEVRGNAYSLPSIALIASAGGDRAVPDLQAAFARSMTALNREALASALIRLGQKDPAYWLVLSKRAIEIVDSRAPCPLVYDANGKSVRGVVSPAFLEWAKSNNVSLHDALTEQTMMFPAELSLMAVTMDPRGIPILRKGLSSPNFGVQFVSAHGLAALQDSASILLIVQAARRAPSELQGGIARPLLFFVDDQAAGAADELIADKKVLEESKQAMKEKGIRGLW
jgi:hypothetical protein